MSSVSVEDWCTPQRNLASWRVPRTSHTKLSHRVCEVRGDYPALADNGIRMRNYFHVCLNKGWGMQATFPSITLYFTKHQMW